MTSVMQGVLFNLRNYFFRTVPQEVCFSQKPDSYTLHHSKFLFLFPPRNSRQLSYSYSALWSYCHQLTSFLPALSLYSHCFLPSPNSSGSWNPIPTEFNRAQWKAEKVNPRGCLEDSLLTAKYIPGTCWTPLWNCGYRESSSIKENKHSIKEQNYLIKNVFILTS